MSETAELLLALVNAAVFDVPPDIKTFSALSRTDWEQVTQLATKHNLGHLVGEAASKYALVTDETLKAALSNKVFTAMQRYYTLENELETLKKLLDQQSIPYLPLKGAVLRSYYPKPWLRSSCDVDILVHQEDFLRADETLTASGYVLSNHTTHDYGYESPDGVHIELHHTLLDAPIITDADKPLAEVWRYAEKQGENTFAYTMSDELFAYYHIAHLAKHCINGGCGIRPLIDWELLKRADRLGNREELARLLRLGGLEKFTVVIEKLTRVWFEGETHDDLSRRVESFILIGGVFGTKNSHIRVRQAGMGRTKYLLSRLWRPYDALKLRYPSLERHKRLLWLYEIYRLISLPFTGRLNKRVKEFKTAVSMSQEQLDDAGAMLKALGITR